MAKRRWDFKVATTWELDDMGRAPADLVCRAKAEEAHFQRLLDDGYKPIGARAIHYGSAWSSSVWLRKKLKKRDV